MERVYGLGGTSVGRYQLGDCLGHGSCTAVYRASAAGGQCAVKLVDGRPHEGRELANRLGRERAIIDRIGHDGILPLGDTLRFGDLTAVVMPLKPAASLRDLMARGPLETELAWSILNQVAQSLHLAHRRGLVYRVLKPANILVDASGRVYLAEFGITSRRIGQLALVTPEFQVAAPQYLAPEQIEGGRLDHRTDVYAFGVLAFELATGTPLRGTGPPGDVLRATLHLPEPSANTRNPHLPREVDAVFARALSRDPGRRHRSVWELVDELLDPPEVPPVEPAVAVGPSPSPGADEDGAVPELTPLDVSTVEGLLDDLPAAFFALCVRMGRQAAGHRWPRIAGLAGLPSLDEDPPEHGERVPDVLTLSRLADAFDAVLGQEAPRCLAHWGLLVARHWLRSIQERPAWIGGPPTGRLVDLLSVWVEALDGVRGDELHAWKQVNRNVFRVVHMQNLTAVGRRRHIESCDFWKGAYEAALEWAGLAGDWLVAEAECGCVTGTYDCVYTLVRANR